VPSGTPLNFFEAVHHIGVRSGYGFM
jgi:hypothetical protein